MNYELAKELKEAGFPQKQPYYYDPKKYTDEEAVRAILDGKDIADVYIPTLEELIEACGENLYSLYRHHNEWQAHSNSDQWDTEIENGKTPTEAVANLWLALNKKK